MTRILCMLLTFIVSVGAFSQTPWGEVKQKFNLKYNSYYMHRQNGEDVMTAHFPTVFEYNKLIYTLYFHAERILDLIDTEGFIKPNGYFTKPFVIELDEEYAITLNMVAQSKEHRVIVRYQPGAEPYPKRPIYFYYFSYDSLTDLLISKFYFHSNEHLKKFTEIYKRNMDTEK